MKLINHQFKNEVFFVPNWTVNHLFLGTFNPEGGEKVNYFYGRKRNRTWELLSNIFNENLNPINSDFFEKIKKNGIACMDVIESVHANESLVDKITGKGYSDSAIINKTVNRNYNSKNILDVINKNRNIKVYTTWGKGPNLLEWRNEIKKIPQVINIVSPSMAARVPKGTNKYEYMLEDWRKKIKI